MALTNTGLVLLPAGGATVPSSGVTVANSVSVEPAFVARVTLTGDGAATTSVVNFIDGVNALSYTPSGITAAIVGGTDTVGVLKSAAGPITALTATSFTLNYSTAPAAATSIVLIQVYR
jgi:hypothetical protein